MEKAELTKEEESKYRPLYNKLVAADRVAASFGIKDNALTLDSFQRRSKRCIRKLGHQVIFSSMKISHEYVYIIIFQCVEHLLHPSLLSGSACKRRSPVQFLLLSDCKQQRSCF